MAVFSKKRDFVIPETGLDSFEKVTLGDTDQAVLIQAFDPSKPVLLFVHGGPCMPVPGVASRGRDYAIAVNTKELVKHFVVVFWDQRGAGKSYDASIPAECFRVEQFVRDCNQLIDLLRIRFHQEKIYLAAHSWGTIIGLSIASRFPEKLHAYAGISQIINWTENDTLCLDWVKNKAEKSGDKKTLAKLGKLGVPPYLKSVKQWTDFRRILVQQGSMVYQTDAITSPGMADGLKIFIQSEDYSLKDIFHTFYSAYKLTYTQALIEDFDQVNFHHLKKVDVPVFLLHGKHDFHVSNAPVRTFYENLDAPYGKEMYLYENSSHMFHPEDAAQIEQLLIHRMKKITGPDSDHRKAVV